MQCQHTKNNQIAQRDVPAQREDGRKQNSKELRLRLTNRGHLPEIEKRKASFMNAIDIKEEAHQLIRQLPDNITWGDIVDKFLTRQVIEAGLRDSEAGKVTDVDEVRASFGLQP